jgi:hypothetical protein
MVGRVGLIIRLIRLGDGEHRLGFGRWCRLGRSDNIGTAPGEPNKLRPPNPNSLLQSLHQLLQGQRGLRPLSSSKRSCRRPWQRRRATCFQPERATASSRGR